MHLHTPNPHRQADTRAHTLSHTHTHTHAHAYRYKYAQTQAVRQVGEDKGRCTHVYTSEKGLSN